MPTDIPEQKRDLLKCPQAFQEVPFLIIQVHTLS